MLKEKQINRTDLLIELFNFALNNTEKFQITPDKGGWMGVITLVTQCQKAGYTIDRADIINIISKNKEKELLKFINNSYVKSLKKSEVDDTFFKDIVINNAKSS